MTRPATDLLIVLLSVSITTSHAQTQFFSDESDPWRSENLGDLRPDRTVITYSDDNSETYISGRIGGDGGCYMPESQLSQFQPGPQSLVQQVRPLPYFTGIVTSGPINVDLQIGSVESVTIEARADVLPYIDIRLSPFDAGTLRVSLVDPNGRPVSSVTTQNGVNFICLQGALYYIGAVRITVTLRSLSSIDIRGSGDVVALTPVTTPSLTVTIHGSGNVRAIIQAGRLAVDVSGAGKVSLSGAAVHADLELGGAGAIHGENLLTDTADATVRGVGSVFVNCRGYLSAKVTGIGNVFYRGGARVSQTVTGMGRVSPF
ncbi:hypothetical protein BV898_14626 [Hypsibius exemplaris]|uniref:Putative auto-transporter adhesin head GIN domain-containing protein n=1 Tax=Hypsibius exemplaris TaxID=2072580 RepID=A0A9X6N903_HYPEX|nr:hypothetical protein BV898_14626 [Hypsibius exemplaris]